MGSLKTQAHSEHVALSWTTPERQTHLLVTVDEMEFPMERPYMGKALNNPQ